MRCANWQTVDLTEWRPTKLVESAAKVPACLTVQGSYRIPVVAFEVGHDADPVRDSLRASVDWLRHLPATDGRMSTVRRLVPRPR